MKPLALARRQAALSPERTALAAAIEKRQADEAAHQAALQAEERASAAVDRARRTVWTAQDALDEGQAAVTQHAQAVAFGNAGTAPLSVRQLQANLVDAESTMMAAEAALEAIRAEVRNLASPWSASTLKRAVSAVVQAESNTTARAVAAELTRLQREMVRHGQLLGFLIDAGAFPVDERIGSTHGRPSDPAIRDAFGLLNSGRPTAWQMWQDTDGAAGWRAALAALETDAAAPLPGVA